MTMNIELVAPAGSGKTFLIKRLIAQDRSHLFVHQKRISALLFGFFYYRFLCFLDRTPFRSISKKSFKLVDRFYTSQLDMDLSNEFGELEKIYLDGLRFDKNYDSRLYIFKRALAHYFFTKKISKNGDFVFLFDEGVAQRGCSLVYSGCDLSHVARFYECSPLPDKLVFLNVGADIVAKNLINRDGYDSKFLKDVDLSFKACELCCNIFARRGVDIILCNDSSDYQCITEAIL